MSYLGLENYLSPFMESTHRILLHVTPPPRETLNSFYILREGSTITKKCDSDVLVSFKHSLRDSGRELLKRTNLLVQFICQRSPTYRTQKRLLTIVHVDLPVNNRSFTTVSFDTLQSRSSTPFPFTMSTASPPLIARGRPWP